MEKSPFSLEILPGPYECNRAFSGAVTEVS